MNLMTNIEGKRILVTGGCGYIGSHVVVELINLGALVTIIDDLQNSQRSVLDSIKKITGVQPHFLEVDLLDYKKLKYHLLDKLFDYIFHFASLKSVPESLACPSKYYHQNLNSLINLVSVLGERKPKFFIFSSSATIYSLDDSPPFNEDSKIHPSSPYGETKFLSEMFLKNLTNQFGWSIGVLRYFNPVSAHHSSFIGENPSNQASNLFPTIGQCLLRQRSELEIFGNDYKTIDGTGVRDYIHIADLAKGHIAALNFILEHGNFNVWNLGTGKGFSVLQVINAFNKHLDQPIKINFKPRRVGDSPISVACIEKAIQELSWFPEKNLDDMVLDYLAWLGNK